MKRTAECPCGQLAITVDGDPMFVVACSCTLCQRKSGSVFNVVSTFSDKQIVASKGEFKTFKLTGDSRRECEINFCPACGTSVYWKPEIYPECTCIAVGCFADKTFPPPDLTLWNKSKHDWVTFPDYMPCLETQMTEDQVKAKLAELEDV